MPIFFSKAVKANSTVNSTNSTPSNSFTNSSGSFDYNKFIKGISGQESNSSYSAVGPLITKGRNAGTRALGKYQFMLNTLKGLNINVSNQDFLKNSDLQEKAMRMLTTQNANGLGIKDINNMNTRQVKALSMAHYSGLSKAKNFYNNGLNNSMIVPQMTTGKAFPSINTYANQSLEKMGEFGTDMTNIAANLVSNIKNPSLKYILLLTLIPKTMKKVFKEYPTVEEFNNSTTVDKQDIVKTFRSEVVSDTKKNMVKSLLITNLIPVGITVASMKAPKWHHPEKIIIPATIGAALTNTAIYKNYKTNTNAQTDEQIINIIRNLYIIG